MMKNRVMLFLIGCGLTSLACNNIQEKLLPSFTVSIPPIQLAIPPIPIVLGKEIPVGALKTPINLDSTIKARTAGTLGAEAVHSVKVKRVILHLKNADRKNNLSNFESARIRIYSDTSSSDIAVIRFPAAYSDSLVVVPQTKQDISKFLKGTSLSYNLFWQNRKPTTRRLKLDVQISLDVQ
jgi:hypothetical protein